MGASAHPGQKGREKNAHQLQTALAHTDRAQHEERDLRLAAGLTTNMIANMGKEGKHISMDTLARICETLDCGIMDVIELASDEPSATGGNDNGKTERKNHRERH